MKWILLLLAALTAAIAALVALPLVAPRLAARYLTPLLYQHGRPKSATRRLNAAWSWLVSAGLLPEKWPGEPAAGPASLEVTGRRSGRPRTNMVTWVEYEGQRYFVSMLGPESDWVRNIRAAGGEGVLRRRGHRRVRLQETPIDESAPIIRQWYLRTWQSTLHHLGVEPDADISDFQRIAARHPVFRIVLLPEGEPDSA